MSVIWGTDGIHAFLIQPSCCSCVRRGRLMDLLPFFYRKLRMQVERFLLEERCRNVEGYLFVSIHIGPRQ